MLLRIGLGPSTEEIANAVHGKLQGVFPTADEIAKAVKKEVESLITAVKTAVESVSKGLNDLTAKTEKLWTSTEQSVQHAETAVAHTVAIAGSLAHSYAEWEQQHESTFKAKLTHFFDGIVAIAEQVPSIFLSIRIDVDKPLHDFIVRQINLTPGVVLWGLDKSLSKASVHSPAGGVTPWQDLPDEVVAFLKRLPPLEGPPEVVCPRIMAPGMPLPWEVHRARTLVRLLVEAARVASRAHAQGSLGDRSGRRRRRHRSRRPSFKVAVPVRPRDRDAGRLGDDALPGGVRGLPQPLNDYRLKPIDSDSD